MSKNKNLSWINYFTFSKIQLCFVCKKMSVLFAQFILLTSPAFNLTYIIKAPERNSFHNPNIYIILYTVIFFLLGLSPVHSLRSVSRMHNTNKQLKKMKWLTCILCTYPSEFCTIDQSGWSVKKKIRFKKPTHQESPSKVYLYSYIASFLLLNISSWD